VIVWRVPRAFDGWVGLDIVNSLSITANKNDSIPNVYDLAGRDQALLRANVTAAAPFEINSIGLPNKHSTCRRSAEKGLTA